MRCKPTNGAMMVTVALNVRLDESLKARMYETASAIGLTIAAVFNAFVR